MAECVWNNKKYVCEKRVIRLRTLALRSSGGIKIDTHSQDIIKIGKIVYVQWGVIIV